MSRGVDQRGEFFSGSMLDEKSTIMMEEGRRCRMLIAAVILQAVLDVGNDLTKAEKKKQRNIDVDARSALFFLLHRAGGLDAYCAWLDIDAGALRRRLRDGLSSGGQWMSARATRSFAEVDRRRVAVARRIRWFDAEAARVGGVVLADDGD
jgi:hypothetical protein